MQVTNNILGFYFLIDITIVIKTIPSAFWITLR